MVLLTALTLATLTVAPTVQFTSDSVYTKSNIVSYNIRENYSELGELESKDLVFTKGNLLGYEIFDNPETPYIDGLKIDDTWITDWVVPNYDDSVAHTISIKTVYTDDIAGALAAAKNGDWSRVLQNPVMILQVIYFAVSTISILLGGFGLLKSKGKKIKTAEEIASAVTNSAELTKVELKELCVNLIDSIITPVYTKLQNQNQDIIEALILTRSGDEKASLALIDLLKKASNVNIDEMANTLKKEITEAIQTAKTSKEEAQQTIKAIAEGTLKTTSEIVTEAINDRGTDI